jgi:uncharacterized protein (DUF58 family)
VTDVFAGEFESAIRGRGIEFEEFREYVPGDDIRQIAWNVTARMDKPFVKVFREEREQTIFFLIDLSESQDFGRGRTKRDIVTEIAALLAYATIKSGDKIGLILFTDRIETFIPPKKGRAHVWRIIAEILSRRTTGKGTKISAALRHFVTVCPRRSTCFLMSDFWDDSFERDMSLAAFKHDLIVLRVQDEMESKLPQGALIDFSDNESHDAISADLSSSAGLKRVQQTLSDRELKLKNFFHSRGIDELKLGVDEDYAEALMRFFIRRDKRR